MCDYLGKCHLGDDQAFTFRGKGLAPPHVFVALPCGHVWMFLKIGEGCCLYRALCYTMLSILVTVLPKRAHVCFQTNYLLFVLNSTVTAQAATGSVMLHSFDGARGGVFRS